MPYVNIFVRARCRILGFSLLAFSSNFQGTVLLEKTGSKVKWLTALRVTKPAGGSSARERTALTFSTSPSAPNGSPPARHYPTLFLTCQLFLWEIPSRYFHLITAGKGRELAAFGGGEPSPLLSYVPTENRAGGRRDAGKRELGAEREGLWSFSTWSEHSP